MFYSYCRVSTAEQADDTRSSLDDQRNRCRAIATMRGQAGKYDYQEFVDAGVSGSIELFERPAGKQMFEVLQKGDVICAAKMDRIFRSAGDAIQTVERLKKMSVGLVLCDMGVEPIGESPAATMFFTLLAAFAQFERERIHERITEGKIAKKARGGHIGGAIPFGYKRDGRGRNANLVPNEREREHIRRCYALRTQNPDWTLRRISETMRDEGMVDRKRKAYGPVAILRLCEAAPKFLPKAEAKLETA